MAVGDVSRTRRRRWKLFRKYGITLEEPEVLYLWRWAGAPNYYYFTLWIDARSRKEARCQLAMCIAKR